MPAAVSEPIAKFFADRGTHLAAMIAYFALLSFVPLSFLALAALGLFGRADESTFLVREIQLAFPATPINRIVDLVQQVQDNATTLGLIGGPILVWTALSLFSVLESAFNIVYDRPNRGFLRGKALATLILMASLFVLFAALVMGSVGHAVLEEYIPGFVGNEIVSYAFSVLISTASFLSFIVATYYFLTNTTVTLRETIPGAILATLLLQASFQVLPIFVRFAELSPVLKTFGSPAILLVWLYVMANVVVFGAELNWWLARRDRPDLEVAGLA